MSLFSLKKEKPAEHLYHNGTTTKNRGMTSSPSFWYCQRWSDVEPRPPSIQAYCHQIPAFVGTGEDVVVDLGGTFYPSRVIEVQANNNNITELVVNVWVEESFLTGQEELPQLDRIRYSNVFGMNGVLRSNWMISILPSSVINYAFIFHCDSLQTGLYVNANGMSNSFYTRYKMLTEQGRNMVSEYSIFDHSPFAHLSTTQFFPESFHHRVFNFLTQLKRNADSVLWTERKYKNSNGVGRSNPLFISYECWIYFVNQLKKDRSFVGCDFTSSKSTRTVRTFFQDLSSQAISFPANLYQIEADDSEQFKCLRKILGKSYGYGVRRPRDTRSSGLATLAVTDRINVLDYYSTGADNGVQIEQEGIDAPEISNMVVFCYNAVTSLLTVRYYYRYVRVSSDRGKQLLQDINHPLSTVDTSNIQPIVEGSTFEFEGHFYRTLVHFVPAESVRAVDMMNGTERHFSVSQARALIDAHNLHDNDDMDL